MIDKKVCDRLGLPINPFSCDISLCDGIVGASMTRSIIAIMGWIEVELGLLGMGCILARFWVADCKYDKGVPVVLGSPMIKEVYKDARRDHYDLWPTVWKDLYMWNAHNEWFENGVLDDLYDSDDYDSDVSSDSQLLGDRVSKQVVRTSSLSSADSWLDLAMVEEDEETVLRKVEAKIAASTSTALKGIPSPVGETGNIETCQSTPAEEAPPVEEEPIQDEGDDSSVFPDWLAQLGSVVGGFDDLKTCNIGDKSGTTFQIPRSSIVSCRLAPTGETILSFQWSQVSETNPKNCSG